MILNRINIDLIQDAPHALKPDEQLGLFLMLTGQGTF
jgi:hypothetical protein